MLKTGNMLRGDITGSVFLILIIMLVLNSLISKTLKSYPAIHVLSMWKYWCGSIYRRDNFLLTVSIIKSPAYIRKWKLNVRYLLQKNARNIKVRKTTKDYSFACFTDMFGYTTFGNCNNIWIRSNTLQASGWNKTTEN